jgi:uncharacterized delta-60 repeat protein
MNNSPARVRVRVASVLALEALEPRTLLSLNPHAGSLDPSFGHNGLTYITARRPDDVHTVAAAALPGGKMLLLGTPPSEDGSGFVLAKLNADGSPDGTFGDHGVIKIYCNNGFTSIPAGSTSVINGFILPNALAVDAQGHIYIGGADQFSAGTIVRLKPNAAPDRSFGNHGVLNNVLDDVSALLCQSDGSILAGGHVDREDIPNVNYVQYDFGVTRLREDGSLDKSFGHDGVAIAEFRGRRYRAKAVGRVNSGVHTLSVDTHGRIIAAGGEEGFFDIARFAKNGSLDKSFGTGGEDVVYGDRRPHVDSFTTRPGPFFSALAIRSSDDEIFAAGGYPFDSDLDLHGGPWVVAAFKSDGRPDTRFGQGGSVQVLPPFDSTNDHRQAEIHAIALLPNGKILIAGADSRGLLLSRLNSRGNLDPSFTPPVTDISQGGVALLPATGGRFIVPIYGNLPGSVYTQLTARRFNSDGSLDDSFGLAGAAVAPFMIADKTTPLSLAAATESPGEIYATIWRDREQFIRPLSADGQPISTILFHDTNQAHETFSVVRVLADRKVLVQHRQDDGSVDLMRYNPDGSIDTSWGIAGHVIFDKGVGGAGVQKILMRPDGWMVVQVRQDPGANFSVFNADTLYLLDPAGKVTASHEMPRIQFNLYDASILIDLALESDNKVVISTSTPQRVWWQGKSNLSVLRLDEELSPDSTFGNSGMVDLTSVSQGTLDSSAAAAPILVLPDSRMLVTAIRFDSKGRTRGSILIALSSSGQLDHTFGHDGILDMGGAYIGYGDLLLQSDGKILVAVQNSSKRKWLSRYNPDGSKDLSFGQNGSTPLPLGSNLITLTQTLHGQMLLIAGTVTSGPRSASDPQQSTSTAFITRMLL